MTELNKRKLPDIFTFFDGKKVETSEDWKKRKEELLLYFQENMYGKLPEKPLYVNSEIIKSEEDFCAGKAVFKKVNIMLHYKNAGFSFPVYTVIPKKKPKFTFLFQIIRDAAVRRLYGAKRERAIKKYMKYSRTGFVKTLKNMPRVKKNSKQTKMHLLRYQLRRMFMSAVLRKMRGQTRFRNFSVFIQLLPYMSFTAKKDFPKTVNFLMSRLKLQAKAVLTL